MVAKVELINNEPMYIVLTSLGQGKTSYKTCFVYINNDQQSQLEKAREFANERAKALGATLEVKL